MTTILCTAHNMMIKYIDAQSQITQNWIIEDKIATQQMLAKNNVCLGYACIPAYFLAALLLFS